MNFELYAKKYHMMPHIENGYFKEIYRSKQSIDNHAPGISSIYFLMEKGAITRIRQLNEIDEIIVYLDGNPVEIIMIDLEGKIQKFKLGKNNAKNENLEVVIPAKYSASFKSLDSDDTSIDFSLFGCICSPAFDYQKFRLLDIDEINKIYPNIDKNELKDFFLIQ